MIKANRDGQEMQFEDSNELLVFLVENMAMRSELKDGLEAVRTELKDDILKLDHNLRDHIDKKVEEVKIHTATLLRNKEIISKDEALEYARGNI